MTVRPTVLLFDIDGTLLSTGGVGRRALERAFHPHPSAEAFGFSFDGMTDRAIVRLALKALGQPDQEEDISRRIDEYLPILADEVSSADPTTYRLHLGMREAVEEAGRRPNVAVGLGTGNVREGARIKLNRVGLYDRFSFGGFGCDHELRPELIRRGAERGAAQLGVSPHQCRVVVIGDTPKDIAAAKAIGAECLAVGTGRHRPDELLAAGATWAYSDLAQHGALETLFG